MISRHFPSPLQGAGKSLQEVIEGQKGDTGGGIKRYGGGGRAK